MDLVLAKTWIIDNANLLSGLAGIVTVVSIILPPMLRRPIKQRVDGGHELQSPVAHSGDKKIVASIRSLSAPASGPGAIAVMPFDSLSSDAADNHLANGISCEIISALSRAGYLRIAPRAESFALRDKLLSLADIGKQLCVRYVVHGSVRHDAEKLRVIAEFADCTNSRLLWTKTYDRPFADLLQVQAEIAQAIAASLGGEAFRAEVLHLSPGTQNPSAWSYLQEARHEYMSASGPEIVKSASRLVTKALELDSRYALAHAMNAQLLMDAVSTGAAEDVETSKATARASIERALELSSRDPEVLMYAGRVWVELGEREKSIAALRRGTELSPYDLMEWGFLARSLAFGSTVDAAEAIAITERILEIAPEHPCVWTWELFHGIASMNLQRYEEAVVWLRKAVTTSPKFTRALLCLASALGACGHAEEAHQVVERSLTINSSLTPQRFTGYVRTMSGNDATTDRITRGLSLIGRLEA
jgi:adenylate cyclase